MRHESVEGALHRDEVQAKTSAAPLRKELMSETGLMPVCIRMVADGVLLQIGEPERAGCEHLKVAATQMEEPLTGVR